MLQKKSSFRFIHGFSLVAFFALTIFISGKNLVDFQANLISKKQAAPYDGLTLPLQKAPNWVGLDSAKWKNTYENIPADMLLPLPVYDPNQLKTPTSQLGWSSAADKLIRNAKITFSTPYMGDYKLDGLEYAGSHLAIDIKVPMHTPVFAIGNGVVVKASTITTGFGNHIVVEHDDFPSFNDPNVKTTYYSSYNHLSSLLVSEGDVVTKGQQIGLTGQSGTATTPHLHFQIDNDQAPWHPYWPFDYKEAADAGLNFSTAVDAGLGKQKAIASTINPMLYVQKYLGVQTNPVSPSPVLNPTPIVTPTSPVSVSNSTPVIHVTTPPSNSSALTAPIVPLSPAAESVPIVAPVTQVTPPAETPIIQPVVEQKPAVNLKFVSDNVFIVGSDKKVLIQAVDDQGNLVSTYKPADGVNIIIENGGATLKQSYLGAADFLNGSASFTFYANGPQGLRFKATDRKISGESEMMQVGKFSDVAVQNDSSDAVEFLKNYKVVEGYPDGSFKPELVVSRVEALKFILKGANTKLQNVGKLPFKDTSSDQWYANYVATAYNSSIVAGYPDLTFRPASTVNRAEFLKMLLTAMQVKLDTNITGPIFDDVLKNDWYAPYVAYAKAKNLIPSNSNLFRPEEGMTRGEVAEIIRRVIVLRVGGQSRYNSDLALSNGQLSKYFGI